MASILAALWSTTHPRPHDYDTMNSKMTKKSQADQILVLEHKNCSGMLFSNSDFRAVNVFCVDAAYYDDGTLKHLEGTSVDSCTYSIPVKVPSTVLRLYVRIVPKGELNPD